MSSQAAPPRLTIIEGHLRGFLPGDTVTIKPEDFYQVLFTNTDGRIQIIKGKGGMSFCLEPSYLDIRPTDESQREYWKEEGIRMKKFLEDRCK